MTEKDWLASLRAPILVVGNGVLPFPLEKVEGRYTSVIRLNNYLLGGPSGKRVTHWAASGYANIEFRPIAPVLVPWSMDYQRRRIRHDLNFSRRINAPVLHLSRSSHITRWFPMALVRWKLFPSLGFCLLSYLYEVGKKPDIVGFDGMKTGHQSNPRHLHGHKFTRKREWDVIQTYLIRYNLNLVKL